MTGLGKPNQVKPHILGRDGSNIMSCNCLVLDVSMGSSLVSSLEKYTPNAQNGETG